jgi:hypothetical protein
MRTVTLLFASFFLGAVVPASSAAEKPPPSGPGQVSVQQSPAQQSPAQQSSAQDAPGQQRRRGDGPPEQRGPQGLGEEMARMLAEADAQIAWVRTAGAVNPGDLYETAATAIVGIMRPTFGPANAWLFGERERKLAELREALRLPPTFNPDLDLPRLDRFFAALDAAVTQLRAAGLTVETAGISTGGIGWQPAVVGRRLFVTDRSRTVEYLPPYANTPAGPSAEPARVAPRLSVDLFPPRPLRTSYSLVTREQPGMLLGALDAALLFVPQAAQVLDTDDGGVERQILSTLFGESERGQARGRTEVERRALDETARRLGAARAELFAGCLVLYDVETPDRSVLGRRLSALRRVAAVMHSHTEGADATIHVFPVETVGAR